MKVLITGGAGFIGSHLSEALLKQGHLVWIIDDLSTGRMKNVQHLRANPNFKIAIDTIQNETVMDRLVSETDVIYHLAAAVGVELIVEHPVKTIETNIMGSEMVLKLANRYLKKVLIVSTSEVYGKSEKVPFGEEDDRLLGPTVRSRWCYSSSKAIDEYLALAYHKEKGLPTVIVRLFNTVGPRQTGQYGMVIPRMVARALKNEPVLVYGDGTQVRCFTYVTDVVDALIKLMENPKADGEIFNVGGNEPVTIMELARRIKKIAKSSSQIDVIPYDQAYEEGFEDMKIRIPDLSKIKSFIGFEPHHSLDEILENVITYYRGELNLSEN
ncbi:bifunctional polymyxin resistance protein ArnA [bacterium BMS3Abin05]|nr:bifunctional polymyxin resistance protein ArnA [bacterium BMS3Abin05]GBE26596.1 bifunctional polymyxin resistance protein ArnA [bacterium BMS3Bbin03]HDZ11174.1 NAD-dependent epimerase/dehydratase family protein [Bacteroidota bacterium]